MAGNAIPTRSRRIVKERDNNQCQRCGARGSDWHHRRRRAVKGGHFQHCPCNGVWLCRTCHTWAHANPRVALALGYIVSAYDDEPHAMPIRTFQGRLHFLCDGSIEFTEEA